jgi:hypothetical protein
MNYPKHGPLLESVETYRTEEALVETLESNRQADALALKTTDDQSLAPAEPNDRSAPPGEAEARQDRWMESVRAFIRSIDINSL